MSNELAVIDTDSALGALKREAHWVAVIAATGGGLTFTLLAHVLDWSPMSFAVHGVAGLVGGYLVGTGIARALTGVRARAWLRRYEPVTTGNRVIASGLRVLIGALIFYASYLFAVGFQLGVVPTFEPAMLGMVLPFGIWGLILFVALARHLVRAMR